MSKLLAKLQELTHASKQEIIAVTTLLALTIAAAIVTYYRSIVADASSQQWLRQLDSLARLTSFDEKETTTAAEEDDAALPLPGTKQDRQRSRYEPKKPPSRPIDINKASKQELMRLPGIGEVMAERIITARKERPFETPEDLLRVPGIGKKKLEQLRPYIRAGTQ